MREPTVVVHILLVLVQLVIYILYNFIINVIAGEKIGIVFSVLTGLVDVLLCTIICNIVHEGCKVNLVMDKESRVQFIRQ